MPRQEGSSEGSNPTHDASRATAQPISLDIFTVFIENFEKLEQRFEKQDQRFEKQDQRLDEQNPKYVHMKGYLRSNCQTKGLPRQQARPEGEDAYSDESGESEDDSTADGEVRVTPFENN